MGDTIKGAILDSSEFLNFPVVTNKEVDNDNRIAIHSAQMEVGDLVIQYYLNRFPKPEKGISLQIMPKIIVDNGISQVFYPSHLNKWEQTYEENKRKKTNKELKELVWRDFIEDCQLYKKQDFSLVLTGQNEFDYPHQRPLPINLAPHLIGIGIAGGLLLASVGLKSSSDGYNKKYQKSVFLEKFELATEQFGVARSRFNLSNICRISGISILAVDALIFGLRYRKYKKEKEKYDYYLERKIAVQPKIEINTPYQNIGMKVSWTF